MEKISKDLEELLFKQAECISNREKPDVTPEQISKMSAVKKLSMLYFFIFLSPSSKDELAKSIKSTTKTVENRLKMDESEVVYDKKAHLYRFDTLLPSFLPMAGITLLVSLLASKEIASTAENEACLEDAIAKTFSMIARVDPYYPIDTSVLPEAIQKIIQIKIASDFLKTHSDHICKIETSSPISVAHKEGEEELSPFVTGNVLDFGIHCGRVSVSVSLFGSGMEYVIPVDTIVKLELVKIDG